MRLRLKAAVICAAMLATGPAWAQSTGQQPWISDRAVGEGIGIRSGDFEFHPGISGEFGYDSNYFQRADSSADATFGPVIPSLRLRITPYISLRTLGEQRRGESGGGAGAPPKLRFELRADATYNEFFALDSADTDTLREQRHFAGGATADAVFFPERKWSFDTMAAYRRTVEPSNEAGFLNSFDRQNVAGGAGLTWRPGGGLFEWRILGYGINATFFDSQNDGDDFVELNNLDHRFESRGRWRFLPKSALIYDAHYRMVRYTEATNQSDGDLIRSRVGYNGLIVDRFGILAMAGWAMALYDNGPDFDDLVGRAELKWFLTAQPRLQPGTAPVGLSAVAVGFDRDFNNSYLGNFFQRNRGYANFNYFIAGRALTTLEAGFSDITYPNLTNQGITDPTGGFSESRIDVKAFAEYRPTDTVGVNLTFWYDQNFSEVVTVANGAGGSFTDDLSFSRWRLFLGGRWFM